jgi:hypothetical protein
MGLKGEIVVLCIRQKSRNLQRNLEVGKKT